ncbi:hypothetical protein SAMN02799624_02043 [Paenibacillus sp. UNC496MF]|uniref:hypothetical protein n=1 Tax=Paenibacillus sp. UNC496MF TaxID=1502753 RepID=UPI0008E391FB|nr:hypothetical protein [Paenibacillus sp. UNC496MF]SFI75744.1 hypothetical protein SAMN02799624_02043 [Paenibacillus sp. UNC496MF]
MSDLHRIRWFDGQIREGRYPNSAALAERFEISRRQAQRDIEYLAYSLSAPLLYVAKYRGYCYEDKTYAFSLLYMTDEEQKISNYLARRYGQPIASCYAIALLREAAEAEEVAIMRTKAYMSERLRNRFNDIALR